MPRHSLLDRKWLGRCLETQSFRLGVQGQAGQPRRRLQAVTAIHTCLGKPAAVDRLGHSAVPHPHQLVFAGMLRGIAAAGARTVSRRYADAMSLILADPVSTRLLDH